ncbi:MAG: ribokinase [Pirellulaceae bacterium]|nr:ribokinase [Pirellulaceae bacterium]
MIAHPPRIVVVGSLVCDHVAWADRLPRKGETILGTNFGIFSGGKGANQAVQAGRLGADIHMVGRVGDDSLCGHMFESLHESGVNTRFIKKDPDHATGTCCIHVDANGDNTIVIVPRANLAVCPADVDDAWEAIESADVVLCQLEIPIPTVAYAVTKAAQQGKTVILNPAPAQPIPAEILAATTFLTPNETEAATLAGMPFPAGSPSEAEVDAWARAVTDKLLAMGPKAVLITLGERGAYLANDGQRRLVASYPVSAVDVTAAGDAFNGAFAVAIAEGREVEDAVRFANAAGALAATRAGAQPSMPTRSEVEEFMNAK